MALWMLVNSYTAPGLTFDFERISPMVYCFDHSKPLPKYFTSVFNASWLMAQVPCLFHWYFQSESSRDPIKTTLREREEKC